MVPKGKSQYNFTILSGKKSENIKCIVFYEDIKDIYLLNKDYKKIQKIILQDKYLQKKTKIFICETRYFSRKQKNILQSKYFFENTNFLKNKIKMS